MSQICSWVFGRRTSGKTLLRNHNTNPGVCYGVAMHVLTCFHHHEWSMAISICLGGTIDDACGPT